MGINLDAAPLFRRAGGGGSSETPYHPAPSVGHELGVMFGGFGTMLLGALLFYLWWRVRLAKDIREEEERIRGLKNRGLFDEGRRDAAVGEREKREGVSEI